MKAYNFFMRKLSILLSVMLILLNGLAYTQPFTHNEILSSQLTAAVDGCTAWGDYDSDGDMDLLITGSTAGGTSAILYKYVNNEEFEPILLPFEQLQYSHVSWCDYDNNNDLDIFLTGGIEEVNLLLPKAILYKNTGNDQFEEVNAEFEGIYSGASVWTDLDNDGDQDLAYTGTVENLKGLSVIYENIGNGNFVKVNTTIANYFSSDIAAYDYDNDLDTDILISGIKKIGPNNYVKKLALYENQGNFDFYEIPYNFESVAEGNVTFCDNDMDGKVDILANGSTIGPTHMVFIYQNTGGGSFVNIGIEIFGTIDGSATWADYNNDGDPDFLITGKSSIGTEPLAQLYKNVDVSLFTIDFDVVLQPFLGGNAAWADYDNDGNLDMALIGAKDFEKTKLVANIYKNEGEIANSIPSTPNGLISQVSSGSVLLSWDPSTDEETPSAGLSYNIRIGSNPGGSDIVSPMSNINGKRKVNGTGNVWQNTEFKINNLPEGTYYWNVQAIDNNYDGSPFAGEQFFDINYTGIEHPYPENENSIKVKAVYPNPFNNHIYIKIQHKSSKDIKVTVCDTYGRKITKAAKTSYSGQTSTYYWNGLNFQNKQVQEGIYFLQIESEEFLKSVKIIKL
ncbi:MAG: FG-GAP-like repeat-containing protein [Bacteroidales bacterium]|nr:FG-GAP-like repeat-containing protein [Bacteroidales bacterium]